MEISSGTTWGSHQCEIFIDLLLLVVFAKLYFVKLYSSLMNFGHVVFIQLYFVNFCSYFMSFSPVMNKSKKHLIYSGSKHFMKDKLCLLFLSYLTISTPVTIVINVFRNLLIFDWNLLIFAKKYPQKQWIFSSKTLKSPNCWVLKSCGNPAVIPLYNLTRDF